MAPQKMATGKPKRSSKMPNRSTTVDRKRTAVKSRSKAKGGQKIPGKKISKIFFLPALTVLTLVCVVLAGLLYWGGSHPTDKPEQQPKRKSQPASSVPRKIPLGDVETAPKQRESLDAGMLTGGKPGDKAEIDPPTPPSAPADPPVSPSKLPSMTQKEQKLTSPRENFPEEVTERNIKQPVNVRPTPSRTLSADDKPEKGAHMDSDREKDLSMAMNIPIKLPEAPPSTAYAPPTPTKPDLTPTAPLAKVAIIIDDFGQDLKMAEKFASLSIPVTFSILPFQRHSRKIAELAHSRSREVILHIPMEPQGYPMANPGRGALLLSMSGQEVLQNLQTAVESTPYIQGANNHMGSRFTQNPDLMRIVLSELQKRKLYFLDSYTTPKSLGTALAKEISLPHAQRDIFLDHVVTESAIRSQLDLLIAKAKIERFAVGIGHPHEATYRVLLQEIGRFRKEGLEVVSLGGMAVK